MHSASKMLLAAAFGVGLSGVAYAQGPPPDPTHIPFTLPADIQWTGGPLSGSYQARLFGDPSKPGPYGILIKWMPGNFSHPHFHSQDRWVYVVSGTWWVSTSTHFDPSQTYPLPAGTFATDLANTVHWDGAKAGGEPAVLELVGMGPVTTIEVDESGKPLPPRSANR
jgi:quercetin dioxygenase-like cupin family protein